MSASGKQNRVWAKQHGKGASGVLEGVAPAQALTLVKLILELIQHSLVGIDPVYPLHIQG